jgi:serine/threonine-protein kinase
MERVSPPFPDERVIARGEVADVLEVRVSALSTAPVIVKRLRRELCDIEDVASAFRREVAILTSLQHASIVRVLSVGDDDGAPFFVMERLAGLDAAHLLASLRRRRERLHTGVACGIAARVARGLAHAHSLGVVHRDVAPDNVFVTVTGDVKLIDFGIARARDALRLTRTGHVKGKLAYIAPEQLAGLAVDGRADVFGLGMTLWELIVGRHPWAGLGDAALTLAIREEPAPAPSTRASKVSPTLDALVMTMLAKFPAGRPAAAEAAGALERHAFELGVKSIERELARIVARCSA